MSVQNKDNTFYFLLCITLICFGLWLTNPSDAIKECEKVNTTEFCEILDKE